MFNQHHTINVRASQESVKTLLINNQYFTCQFSKNHFSLVEKVFFRNNFLHPIAEGDLYCLQKDTIVVNLQLRLRSADKFFFLLYTLVIFVISAFSIIFTHKIEIAAVIASFALASSFFFLISYKYSCKRFYKKIVTLFKHL